jgi:hypothetical protein
MKWAVGQDVAPSLAMGAAHIPLCACFPFSLLKKFIDAEKMIGMFMVFQKKILFKHNKEIPSTSWSLPLHIKVSSVVLTSST